MEKPVQDITSRSTESGNFACDKAQGISNMQMGLSQLLAGFEPTAFRVTSYLNCNLLVQRGAEMSQGNQKAISDTDYLVLFKGA